MPILKKSEWAILGSSITLFAFLFAGAYWNFKKNEERKGMDLDQVLYNQTYSGEIDSLNVNFMEVIKTRVNGDTAAHYNQMEIILPDGRKVYVGDFDKDGKIDYATGLTWKEGDKLYKDIENRIEEKKSSALENFNW